MERIENLIEQLKTAYAQQAGAEKLLGIVQLLQFELMKQKMDARQSLGTSRVAVVLPFAQPLGAVAGYDDIATKPAKDTAQVQEKAAVEKTPLTVTARKPIPELTQNEVEEIPTLAHQQREIKAEPVKEKIEIPQAQVPDKADSLNDKLKQSRSELFETLGEAPVKDLRKAIGLNDRYMFVSELFRGDENMYERCIKTINNFKIYPEAEYWINRELNIKLGWKNDDKVTQLFYQIVKRRFS
jgi:hypothetical protein